MAYGFIQTWRRGGLEISTDPRRLPLRRVHALLAGTYWAEAIPLAVVRRAVKNSLNFGLYDTSQTGAAALAGFARIISDYATFAYLCDVVIAPESRGRGWGKWLMECVLVHPQLQQLRRWYLATLDAQPLYARFGFIPVPEPERHMEIRRSGLYRDAEFLHRWLAARGEVLTAHRPSR